jgi:hypothetical protein
MLSYSPVKRIRGKYNGHLLNIYDKETFISQSNREDSECYSQKKYIID